MKNHREINLAVKTGGKLQNHLDDALSQNSCQETQMRGSIDSAIPSQSSVRIRDLKQKLDKFKQQRESSKGRGNDDKSASRQGIHTPNQFHASSKHSNFHETASPSTRQPAHQEAQQRRKLSKGAGGTIYINTQADNEELVCYTPISVIASKRTSNNAELMPTEERVSKGIERLSRLAQMNKNEFKKKLTSQKDNDVNQSQSTGQSVVNTYIENLKRKKAVPNAQVQNYEASNGVHVPESNRDLYQRCEKGHHKYVNPPPQLREQISVRKNEKEEPDMVKDTSISNIQIEDYQQVRNHLHKIMNKFDVKSQAAKEVREAREINRPSASSIYRKYRGNTVDDTDRGHNDARWARPTRNQLNNSGENTGIIELNQVKYAADNEGNVSTYSRENGIQNRLNQDYTRYEELKNSYIQPKDQYFNVGEKSSYAYQPKSKSPTNQRSRTIDLISKNQAIRESFGNKKPINVAIRDHKPVTNLNRKHDESAFSFGPQKYEAIKNSQILPSSFNKNERTLEQKYENKEFKSGKYENKNQSPMQNTTLSNDRKQQTIDQQDKGYQLARQFILSNKDKQIPPQTSQDSQLSPMPFSSNFQQDKNSTGVVGEFKSSFANKLMGHNHRSSLHIDGRSQSPIMPQKDYLSNKPITQVNHATREITIGGRDFQDFSRPLHKNENNMNMMSYGESDFLKVQKIHEVPENAEYTTQTNKYMDIDERNKAASYDVGSRSKSVKMNERKEYIQPVTTSFMPDNNHSRNIMTNSLQNTAMPSFSGEKQLELKDTNSMLNKHFDKMGSGIAPLRKNKSFIPLVRAKSPSNFSVSQLSLNLNGITGIANLDNQSKNYDNKNVSSFCQNELGMIGYEKQPEWVKNLYSELCKSKNKILNLEKEKKTMQNENKDLRLTESKNKQILEQEIKQISENNENKKEFTNLVNCLEIGLQQIYGLYGVKYEKDSLSLSTDESSSMSKEIQLISAKIQKQYSLLNNQLEAQVSLQKLEVQKQNRHFDQNQNSYQEELNNRECAIVLLMNQIEEEKEKSEMQARDFQSQHIEMSDNVRNMQLKFKDLLEKQLEMQQFCSKKEDLIKMIENPMISPDNFIKALEQVEQTKILNIELKSELEKVSTELEQVKQGSSEKDQEIEKLEGLVKQQEQFKELLLSKVEGSLVKGVDQLLEKVNQVSTKSPRNDLKTRARLFQMQIMPIIKYQISTEPVSQVEPSGLVDQSAQTRFIIKETQNKQLQTSQRSEKLKVIEEPTNSLKDILNEQINQITNLRFENAKLEDKQKKDEMQMKKSQEKLKKSKKYESFYEKLKAKKYRNCGCQIDMSMVEKKSTYRDVLTTKRDSDKNNYLSSAELQSQVSKSIHNSKSPKKKNKMEEKENLTFEVVTQKSDNNSFDQKAIEFLNQKPSINCDIVKKSYPDEHRTYNVSLMNPSKCQNNSFVDQNFNSESISNIEMSRLFNNQSVDLSALLNSKQTQNIPNSGLMPMLKLNNLNLEVNEAATDKYITFEKRINLDINQDKDIHAGKEAPSEAQEVHGQIQVENSFKRLMNKSGNQTNVLGMSLQSSSMVSQSVLTNSQFQDFNINTESSFYQKNIENTGQSRKTQIKVEDQKQLYHRDIAETPVTVMQKTHILGLEKNKQCSNIKETNENNDESSVQMSYYKAQEFQMEFTESQQDGVSTRNIDNQLNELEIKYDQVSNTQRSTKNSK